MNVLYLNSTVYDFTTATLIEGLTELGHRVACTATSNYGTALPEADIPDFANAADFVIVGSNQGVPYHLLRQIRNPRLMAVDGSDQAAFKIPGGVQFKAVFKRELCAQERTIDRARIFPFPFGAEKRYFVSPRAKDVSVSFLAWMETNPLRNSIHVRLTNRDREDILTGCTYERSYVDHAPQPQPVETPEYRDMLARSHISVSVPGVGYDCARYWEIPAARAMLFAFTPDIEIPDNFVDGVSCATFASLAEFEAKLDYYLAHPDKVAAIAEAGYRHLVAHHTTAHRATYFLEKATAAAARPGFCDDLFSASPG